MSDSRSEFNHHCLSSEGSCRCVGIDEGRGNVYKVWKESTCSPCYEKRDDGRVNPLEVTLSRAIILP